MKKKKNDRKPTECHIETGLAAFKRCYILLNDEGPETELTNMHLTRLFGQ